MTCSWEDEEPQFTAGSTIAGRYRLSEVLGRGSFGAVWSAMDVVTGRLVAVKLLFNSVEIDRARGQLEVHALRQGLPGVVELLDDGSEGDQAFVVMELVSGLPFPGVPVPCAWADISEVVVALLETLGRVHAAFVVHRDLKPANVLVTHDKHVRLLDFGVAYRHGPLARDTQENMEVLGTPAYMAPEQLQRRPITERTDLYSLGLMLYEALSGKLPHMDGGDSLLLARLNKAAPPLHEIAPKVPENTARLIDRLVAIDPSERPASAFEVAAILRGEGAVEDPLFLWLGPRTDFLSVLNTARGGRSVDIVGRPGSGRTRWLKGLREPLSQTRKVHWIEPAKRDGPAAEPLCDLRATAESLGVDPADEAFEEALTARLRAALSDGHALLVDDFAELDAASRAVLELVRASGPVVRALPEPAAGDPQSRRDGGGPESRPGGGPESRPGDVVRILPLTELDLRSLFAGPDLLLHLREDAARILHERTAGVPARVFREVAAWLRLGIARRTRNLIVIPRDALEQLDASVFSAAPPGLDGVERDRRGGKSPGASDRADGRAVHAALAAKLSPGQKGRFSHLWLAGAHDDDARLSLGREAIALATRLLHEGRIGAAVAAIEGGLHALRGTSADTAEERAELFALWAEAAMENGTPGSADRLLHAVYKADPWGEKEVIEGLGRALKVEAFGTSRAFDLAQAIPGQASPRLERLRVRALMNAMRLRLDDAAEEALLQDLLASNAARDEEMAARIRSALGRVRYRQGRFLEAADLHEAAARSGRPLDRVANKNAGAWALFEAFDFERAAALAAEALALAASHRHAGHEAAAAWTLRSIAYRRGVAGGPDMDLAKAAPYAVGRQVQGVILCTEAAAAYRVGHPDALSLATRSHELLAAIGQPRGALLARCLALAIGAAAEEGELDALAQRALSVDGAGIGLQALALLARRGHCLPAGLAKRIAALAAEVPRESWATPMDILSVDECLEALHIPP